MSTVPMNAAALYAAAFKKTEEQCKLAPIFSRAEPMLGTYTFHEIMIIVSAITAGLSIIVSLGQAFYHLKNFVNPGEQKQIVRIILLPPVFAVYYFFSVWFYDVAGYIQPVGEFYESFAMVAIFYLFCTYITPNEDIREAYFAALERHAGGKAKHDRGSLRWFYGIWFCVFQVLPSRVATLAATEYYETTACPLSKKLTYSRATISAVQALSTATCLIAILMFYRRLKVQIGPNHCISKLAVFKGVVGVTLIQSVIFSALQASKVLKPTKYVSYLDITVGVPAFMTCCEMFIFSLLFLVPFWPSPYLPSSPKAARAVRHGFWKALWEVLNVWDIIAGVFFRYKLLWSWPSKKESQKPIGMPKVGGLKVIESEDSKSASLEAV